MPDEACHDRFQTAVDAELEVAEEADGGDEAFGRLVNKTACQGVF